MYKICCVKDCEAPTQTQGLRASRGKSTSEIREKYCRKHVSWLVKHGSLDVPKYAQGSLEFRFWKHVEKQGENDCWEWKADLSRSGYGSLWNPETKRNISAARFSCELHHGKPNDGMFVMHSCDNKRCVNPAHLSWGTAKQNTNDAIKRGLRPKIAIPVCFGEKNPKSKLTLEQARFIKAHPEMKLTELASMYGLSPNCIRGVRIGRTWKEV